MAISRGVILTILICIGTSHCEPILFNLDTIDGFESYGFTCRVMQYTEETCELKSVSHPSLLPSYFPARFRNMNWSPGVGREVLYVEGSGPFGARFELRSDNTKLPTADVLMMKSTKFYTEVYQGFGIWKGYEPEQWWYPGSDPDFTGEWILRENGPIDAFGNAIYIILNNNRLNEMTVFTHIHILLDPVPNKVDEILSPEDFTRLGFTFTTADSVIRNVSRGDQLPAYFPQSFRELEVDDGECIMWLEVDETLPSRRHNPAPTKTHHLPSVVLCCTYYARYTTLTGTCV